MRVFARTSITEYVGSSISRFVYHCEFVAFHLLCTCTICIDYKSKNSIWCVRIYIYTNMQPSGKDVVLQCQCCASLPLSFSLYEIIGEISDSFEMTTNFFYASVS